MPTFGSFRGGKANGSGGGEVIDLPGLNELRRRFSDGGGGMLRFVLIAILVLIVVFSSFFTIDPEEVGVVLRFGAFQRYAQPGLNFKLPIGLEEVMKVPVERQLKEEFGFRTERAGVRTEYSSQQFDDESLMLTGDLNIADVEWVVQYRIIDPYKYLFRVRGVRETFRAMTEAVMREVIGDRTVNEVITVGRQELATLVEEQLQALADQYETGIAVEQVVLQNVYPPAEVRASFNEVNEAEQKREELINTAQAQYNEVIPRASRRGRPHRPGGGGLRARAGQPGAGRGGALHRALRRVPPGAGGDAPAPLPRDDGRRAAEGGAQDRRRRVGARLVPLLDLGGGAQPLAAAAAAGGGQ